MLPKAAVICAVLTLFSAGSQGNKEVNVDSHHIAARIKERFLPFVGQPTAFRRDSGTCLPDSGEFNRRLDLLLCDQKYIRAVFNEIETSNCSNAFYNYTALFYGCGTNDNGDVCTSIEFEDSTYEQCDMYISRSSVNYTSECSSGCRTMLRQLSDSVGCCIHDDYELRIPSLWKNCDIQQPEVCADTPNTAGVLAKKRNVDLCTDKCSSRQLYYVFCKNLDEEYEKLDRECGMKNTVCGFHNGEFCAIYTIEFSDSYFEKLFDECNVNNDACSNNCRNILGEFIDTVDCCFHYFNGLAVNFYNIDDPGVLPDLLSACGIEVPDGCNSFSSMTVPDDFLECAGLTNNNKVNNTINTSGAALQSGVYSIGVIILIGLIGTYI